MSDVGNKQIVSLIIALVVLFLSAYVIIMYLTPKGPEKVVNNVNNYESPFVRELMCSVFTKNCGINSEYSKACNNTLEKFNKRYFINVNVNKNHEKAMNAARQICTKFPTLADVYLVELEEEKECTNNIISKILGKDKSVKSVKKESIHYAAFTYVSFEAKQNTTYCVVVVEKNPCFRVSSDGPKVICGVDNVPVSFNKKCANTNPDVCYYYHTIEKYGSNKNRYCQIKVIVPLLFDNKNEICNGDSSTTEVTKDAK